MDKTKKKSYLFHDKDSKRWKKLAKNIVIDHLALLLADETFLESEEFGLIKDTIATIALALKGNDLEAAIAAILNEHWRVSGENQDKSKVTDEKKRDLQRKYWQILQATYAKIKVFEREVAPGERGRLRDSKAGIAIIHRLAFKGNSSNYLLERLKSANEKIKKNWYTPQGKKAVVKEYLWTNDPQLLAMAKNRTTAGNLIVKNIQELQSLCPNPFLFNAAGRFIGKHEFQFASDILRIVILEQHGGLFLDGVWFDQKVVTSSIKTPQVQEVHSDRSVKIDSESLLDSVEQPLTSTFINGEQNSAPQTPSSNPQGAKYAAFAPQTDTFKVLFYQSNQKSGYKVKAMRELHDGDDKYTPKVTAERDWLLKGIPNSEACYVGQAHHPIFSHLMHVCWKLFGISGNKNKSINKAQKVKMFLDRLIATSNKKNSKKTASIFGFPHGLSKRQSKVELTNIYPLAQALRLLGYVKLNNGSASIPRIYRFRGIGTGSGMTIVPELGLVKARPRRKSTS